MPLLRWVPLREKQHCYTNLNNLGLPDRELQKHVTGSICLAIRYQLQEQPSTIEGAGGRAKLLRPDADGLSLTTSTVPLPRRRVTLSLDSSPDRPSSVPALLPSMLSKEEQEVSTVLDSFLIKNSIIEPATPSDDLETRSVIESSVSNETTGALRLGVTRDARVIDEGGSVEDEPGRTDEEEIKAVQAELASSREMHQLMRKISGWFLDNDDYQVVLNLFNSLAAYGQGVEVGRMALTVAFLLVQRFHRGLPTEFTNNIILTKEDIELPRIIFKYAYAAHGWPALYFFGKRRDVFSDALGRNSNHRAVLEYLQMDPNDMLICDLDQHRLFRPNFYVALDRRLSAVILSIRGTMSFRDSLTDLSFDYVPWGGGIVHSGMLMSARWFLENVAKQLPLFATEYQMTRILLTGHSLGGATAALTTILLTEELERANQWPVNSATGKRLDIHCYAFGTPPVLSPDLARKYAHLIDSFIYGDDGVPRLSYGTMADLQVLMVYAAEVGRAGDLFIGEASARHTELQLKLHACRAAIQRAEHVVNAKLHVPGRIHHLLKIKTPMGRAYTVIDTCGPERFCEMILKGGILTHHLPNRYENAFENAYITYLMHELEERQTAWKSPPTSMKNKLESVLSLIRSEGTGSFTSSSGILFPHPSSTAPQGSVEGASSTATAESGEEAVSVDTVDAKAV